MEGQEVEEEVFMHRWEVVTPEGNLGPQVVRMVVPGGYIYRVEKESFYVKHEEFQHLMGGLLEAIPGMFGIPTHEGEVRDFRVVPDEDEELPEA